MRSLSIPGSTKKAGVLFLKQANSKVAPTALIHASVPACLCCPAVSIPGPHSLRPFHSLLTSCRWKWVTTSVVRVPWRPLPLIILLIPPGRPGTLSFSSHLEGLVLLSQQQVGFLSLLFSWPSPKALLCLSSRYGSFLPQGLYTCCSWVSPTFLVANSSFFWFPFESHFLGDYAPLVYTFLMP